jgi:cyclohexa-1,5-dienecarbonyl-CoA hydratase
MGTPLRCTSEREGELLRLVLNRPKSNVLDGEMIGAIRQAAKDLASAPRQPKLIVFEGEGKHFSFGASVEEHLPDRVESMLTAFHQTFRELENLQIPTAAIVRGQCLGGGLELALWCGTVFADSTAVLGVPESKLAVFPPVGAIVLPWRCGGGRAYQLVLTGETIGAEKAAAWGMIDHLAPDPEAALQAFFDEQLAPKSAVALRFAWRAARRPLARALREDLAALEQLYLWELMAHKDPAEGIQAFIERRAPAWRNE